MNAYLVSIPALDNITKLIKAMEAVGVWERPWMGLLPFAYLAGDVHVVQVICRDAAQLAELLDGIEGAQYLHVGRFNPSEALHHVIIREAV